MKLITKTRVTLAAAVVAAVAAFSMLNDIRRAHHIEATIAELKSPSSAVHNAALDELSRITDPDEVPILVRHLADDDDTLRADLTVALVRIGEPAVSPLVSQLRHAFGPQWAISRSIQQFTRQLAKSQAERQESERLDRRAFQAAFYTLSLIGRPSIGPLSQLSQPTQDTNPLARATVTQMLGAIPCQAAIAPLAAALQDGDDNVEMKAVTALVPRPEEEAATALAQHAAGGDAGLRQWQGSELSRLNDRRAIPLLISELGNSAAPNVRRDCALSLAPFDDENVAAALEKVLCDKVSFVRMAALESLSGMSNAHAREALARAGENPDAALRAEAAPYIGRLAVADSQPKHADESRFQGLAAPILPLFCHVDTQAKCAILLRLCWVADDSRTVDFLLPVAANTLESPSVRAMAVWALRFSRDDRAVPAIIAALSDSAGEVRDMAHKALVLMPPQQTIGPLTKALESATGESKETLAKVIEEAKKQDAAARAFSAQSRRK
jgi:HEAT repeat protein